MKRPYCLTICFYALVVFLFSCKDPIASESVGKTFIVLSGNITDAEAAIKIANELGANTEFVWILNTTQLTTVDFSGITELVELKIEGNDALVLVNLENLQNVYDRFLIANNTRLISVDLPSLTTSTGFGNNDGWFFGPRWWGFHIGSNDLVSTINLPNLTSVDDFSLYNLPSLVSVDLTNLTTATGSINISSNKSLPTINLPNLTSVDDFSIIRNEKLTTLNMPELRSIADSYIELYDNAFSSASVNALLAILVAIDPPLTSWIGLTQKGAAPPTGQGVTDKATLENNGNTVRTD